jgi:thiol-disulfide isomerase/thioredoxin
MQLAMASEKEHIEALFEDAAALAQRDPQSQAAAEAARALVELAYFHARNSQKDDTRWLQEFAFQATHFATQFPKEEPRSVPLLFTASRSCELFGLTKEAMSGFAVILEKFPNNAYAPRATGILRRMRLPGQSVDLSGTTINGKPFNVTSLRGKPVLVVFWSTDAQPCIEQMPVVIAAAKKFTPDKLSVMGVNLDTSTKPVTQFLVANKIGWPQIFPAAEEKRGWSHPIVNQYGVLEIPSMWLLDAAGKVVTTSVSSDDLESELEKLCGTTTEKKTVSRETKSDAAAPLLDSGDDVEEAAPVEKPAPRATKKTRTASSKSSETE